MRAVLTVVMGGALAIVAPTAVAPSVHSHDSAQAHTTSPDFTGYTSGEEGTTGVTAVRQDQTTAFDDDSEGPTDRYIRADGFTCSLFRGLDLAQYDRFLETCPDGAVTIADGGTDCGPEAVELAPLWVERLGEDGQYQAGELVQEGGCVTPGDVAAEAERAFAALQVTAPRATVQATRPLLVNVRYPVQANAEPLEEQVTLLDVPVLIRAEPVEYTWDFDDPFTPGGGTLTTTDEGRWWQEGQDEPDDSWVGHTYTHLGHPDTDAGTRRDDEGDWYRDDVTITLTTTWQGRFQLVGTSTWTDIDGTITTTSTIDPLRVTEARVRLVCTDLNGNTTC
ncbi:hypothetical protein ACNHYB_13990 [Isoptericola jiangsuensis]|uniref:hypothetical protein n=1 Tax=Isoptericola jiangsuensis TaxID=548579 RepID=UPI003AABDB0E